MSEDADIRRQIERVCATLVRATEQIKALPNAPTIVFGFAVMELAAQEFLTIAEEHDPELVAQARELARTNRAIEISPVGKIKGTHQ